jgi:iron(III) transport system substrate-binding protein
MSRRFSRRKILKGAAALPLVYVTPLRAAAPPAERIAPALIAAATKEGQLTWYTSADLRLAEKVGKAFEQKFPGIRVRVERAGANASFHAWHRKMHPGCMLPMQSVQATRRNFSLRKRQKLLVPCVPEDVARHIPPEHRDPHGSMRRSARRSV